MKKLSLYGAYGSIKVEGAPRIMFYDFMVAPFASPPIPMMDGLGVFVYAQFASPTEIGSFQTLGCMSFF